MTLNIMVKKKQLAQRLVGMNTTLASAKVVVILLIKRFLLSVIRKLLIMQSPRPAQKKVKPKARIARFATRLSLHKPI